MTNTHTKKKDTLIRNAHYYIVDVSEWKINTFH